MASALWSTAAISITASVLYKQTLLPKPEPDLSIVSIQDPEAAEVVATAINSEEGFEPLRGKSGNFWYFADKPLSYMGEGTRYLVLCDLLHDILGINHPAEMRAMVRIEDVSVDDDPDDLTQDCEPGFPTGIFPSK